MKAFVCLLLMSLTTIAGADPFAAGVPDFLGIKWAATKDEAKAVMAVNPRAKLVRETDSVVWYEMSDFAECPCKALSLQFFNGKFYRSEISFEPEDLATLWPKLFAALKSKYRDPEMLTPSTITAWKATVLQGRQLPSFMASWSFRQPRTGILLCVDPPSASTSAFEFTLSYTFEPIADEYVKFKKSTTGRPLSGRDL